MARRTIHRDVRKAINEAREMVGAAEKADANEAETRRRIERIFETVMGYDAFRHLSRERAVRGAGETEHVDFAIQLEEGDEAKPKIMVEIKRVSVDLAPKHLRQVSSYAINAGSEWILLTNSKEWRLYHVSFGQPPITKLMFTWNLLEDDVASLAQRFSLISYKNVARGGLDKLWTKASVLLPRNVLEAIFSEDSVRVLRRELKRTTGVFLSLEDVVSGVRRLLNESAAAEMENMRISFPEHKARGRRRKVKEEDSPSTGNE